MINKKVDFMEARNQLATANGEEIIFKHFIKSKRGYMLNLFFGETAIKFLTLALINALFFLFSFLIRSDKTVFLIFIYSFWGFLAFCWLVHFFIGVWFWKYSKNVIVTSEGIWIMFYNTGWFGRAFDGKKHFFSPCWSLYDWSELKNISEFSDRISRMNKLKCFKMHRWDGIEKVYYLREDDFNSLLSFAKENMRYRKKKKQDEHFNGVEKFFKFLTGERDKT